MPKHSLLISDIYRFITIVDRRYSREGRSKPIWLQKYGPPTRTDNRLIVGNLSSRVSWQDLKDYMRQVTCHNHNAYIE